MDSIKEKAIKGKNWKSILVHVEYDEKAVLIARHEFVNLNFVHKQSGPIPTGASIYDFQGNSVLSTRITKVTAFVNDLNFKLYIVEKMLKHHFIEIETEEGHIFTLEKLKDCIVLQSCRSLWYFVPKLCHFPEWL